VVPPCSDRISRVPPYSYLLTILLLRAFHSLWSAIPHASDYFVKSIGLVRFRSPLLTESRLISFPPATEMFHFAGFASLFLYIQKRIISCEIGFPHSDILGSKPACGSPKLIVACHVLLRLCTPRHPPVCSSFA
jgi:hypothetical protein